MTWLEFLRSAEELTIVFTVLLGVGIAAALIYIRIILVRLRVKDEEIKAYTAREETRKSYCQNYGHHLGSVCICTRCLIPLHDFEVISEKTNELGTELINPNADPGALHLDSNFQPDWDYGLTQKVYEEVKVLRCTRCGEETVTRRKYEVPDPR